MLDTVSPDNQYAATPDLRAGRASSMPLVIVISREPRMRSNLTEYLRERGYDTATAPTYDDGIALLASNRPDALVVDVQGLPRGEEGITFQQFNQWLAVEYQAGGPPLAYLLHKGARRPQFRVEGAVIKKPFPLESLGEVLRERLGHPRRDGSGPGLDLDLATNTLSLDGREEHLTNIEANLLAYLIAHEGEILHPHNLLVDVWQYRDSAGASTLVRAHMSNLRRKLRSVSGTARQIQTIRGKGYRFVA
ncbi:response regulator transcription factor [bacterium]|nr:response regulator transcription factor [bacterium]